MDGCIIPCKDWVKEAQKFIKEGDTERMHDFSHRRTVEEYARGERKPSTLAEIQGNHLMQLVDGVRRSYRDYNDYRANINKRTYQVEGFNFEIDTLLEMSEYIFLAYRL